MLQEVNQYSMKISSRLIIILALSVNAVLIIATFFILRQLETNLRTAAQDEIRAHVTTLRLALEEDYLTGRTIDAQRLINRLSENTSIYGAILFNKTGQVEIVSSRLSTLEVGYFEAVKQVLSSAQPAEIIRQINGEDVFSVIAPIKNGENVVGAIAIAQPISFIRSEVISEQKNIAWTALGISIAILIVVSMVLHFSLSRPIKSLLDGAIAIGAGNLSHRVKVKRSSGEFLQLANEFNQMADRLGEQRNALAREAETRIALGQKLRHSEQLAAIGRLAAGVAHEMGAPLQVIDGRAKQLLDRDNSLEMRQRNLTIIRTQAERITRIVKQLLNLSRPYHLQLKTVKISDLIRESIDAVEVSAAASNVKITTNCPSEIVVKVDAGLILQALLNVCQNAIQAMPTGGTLTIECFKEKEAQAPLIKISDTGTGIPAEHLDHIFDPFYTTKEVGQGTGLGLAVTSRIMEEHGGRIEAENNPACGATFYLHLPPLKTDTKQV